MVPQTFRQLGFAIAGVAAPILTLALLAPILPIPAPYTALCTFAAASAAIVFGCTLAPPELLRRPRALLAIVVAGLGLSALAFALPPVASGLAGSLGVIACAWVLGTTVGSHVAHPGHLLPVAALSSAVDLWSVTSPSGPTHHIVRNKVLVRLLTVSAALPPSREPEPAIGFGDVVFVALYLAVAARYKLSRPRALTALSLGLFAAGAVAIGLRASIPALPLLGAAVVLLLPESRAVPREDRPVAVFALLALVASVARAVTR